jgi:hypothetical protein
MKKCTLFLFVMLMSLMAQAGDLTGIKIYVNPGHGGHDVANDRNILTIPFEANDPNGYWESNSNLAKGLALRDMLLAADATVIMSRTLNRNEDDRELSTIVAEANASNADAFLSIHSNAGGATTNYTLMLYAGVDPGDTWPYPTPTPYSTESSALSTYIGNNIISNQLTVWTSSSPAIRGDKTFGRVAMSPAWSDGYGVLRGLTVPGLISEGEFHEYKPEAHRLLNTDYCKLESYQFYRSFCQYFNKPQATTGVIAGYAKSENEPILHPRYTIVANSQDRWLPLNGATVKLLDATGTTELGSYTTDDWYNGVFAFYDLAPGNYKVSVSAAAHEPKTVDVTVTAGQTAYAKVQLLNPTYEFDQNLDPDYPEQGLDAVTLAHYDFVQQGATATFDALNSLSIKRVLFRNNKFYVLTTEPKILIYDAATQAALDEMSLTGVSGGNVIVSDISFAADGKLVACNKATIPLESPTTSFKVYKWDNDGATPTLLFESQRQANWITGIIGETFTVSGATDHMRVYTTAVTTGSSKQIRIVAFEFLAEPYMLVDKYMGSEDLAHGGTAKYTEAEWGAHPKFTITPSGESDHFVVDSDIFPATEYQFDWELADRFPLTKKGIASVTTDVSAQGVVFARYAGHTFMAAPACGTNGTGVRVALYDVTNGLDVAVQLSDAYPTGGLGATPAGAMLAGITIDGYDIELVILAQNQGTARYKTEQSPVAAIYASEVSYADDQFHFTLNENASAVTIEIYDNGTLIQTHNAGALTKGSHSIANPFGSTTFNSFGITASARPVTALARISTDEPIFQFYAPRGVTVDNTPESPYFGRIYVTETGTGKVTVGTPPNPRTTQRGIYILNAAHEDVTAQGLNSYNGGISWGTNIETPGHQYAPMRPAVAPDGKLYISDSSYGNSGVYVMDPSNPSAAFKPVFGGTRNTANGQASEGGVPIHNQISNCYVMGTGANTQLYTLDRTASPVTGKIQRYDIGEALTPWTAAPSATVFSDPNNRMQNSYGTIAYDSHGGWWLSQYRAGAGGEDVPTLLHATNNVEDFNVGATWPSGYRGVVAVSMDGSTLALSTERGKAQVFDVTYDAANKPSITPTYTIEWGGTSSDVQGAAFDVAGNLYLVSNGNERLMIYAFPKLNNSYTTRVSGGNKTGIDSAKAPADIAVYPNPVGPELIIDGQGTPLQTYTLYDLNGRAVCSEKINDTKHTVSVAGLNAGLYLLQVQTDKGVITKQLIKK